MSFMEKLFGNFSDKELKRIKPIANKVLELEPEMQKLTDEELQAKTPYLKEKLKNGASLDDILPEAFAVCREADWRVLGLKPYPVQIIGGIVLHRSCIAEMQTGEGKTLVATMPVYLNALTGEGVHVVTVNDYLAKRDSEWMGTYSRRTAARLTWRMLLTAPTTSLALTTCVTTWWFTRPAWCSAAMLTPSWTRWTPS